LKGKPFELRVVPGKDDDYGLVLTQDSLLERGVAETAHRFSINIRGIQLKVCAEQVISSLKQNGYRASDLGLKRKVPFHINEENGVKLALLFMAIKPLRKVTRMEAIASEVRRMEMEEAYYWLSKCTSANSARSQRALRILLSEE
jgi:hypothetical protein